MELIKSTLTELRVAHDPVFFQQQKLIRVLPGLDDWQAQACKIRSPGLLLLCGRQTGKSTFASVMALWKVMTEPDTLVLLISPTLRQSSELFRKTMVLYDALDQPKPPKRSQTELWLPNGSKIFSLPGANPDAIRGFSAPDLIIEDESAFVNDRTFVASRPMLATNARGRHILLTTPYGKRGHFHELWTSGDPEWQCFKIKSKDCERIATSFLESERRVLSDRAFRQEYECEFLEAANAVFPADLIERLMDDDERRTMDPGEASKTHQQRGLESISVKTEVYADI